MRDLSRRVIPRGEVKSEVTYLQNFLYRIILGRPPIVHATVVTFSGLKT